MGEEEKDYIEIKGDCTIARLHDCTILNNFITPNHK